MAAWSIGPYLPSRDLRIGTVERERAAQLLGDHLAAGRLDLAEFEERVAAAYAARTNADLRALFRDLPGPVPVGGAAPVPRRVPRRTVLVVLMLVVLGVTLVEVALPPFLLIGAVWLVLGIRRRRYAYAAGRRTVAGGYRVPGRCHR